MSTQLEVFEHVNSSLPEFERRLQGPIRGDAKKFALERATEFITQFGIPDEFAGIEESESRFKEVCTNSVCGFFPIHIPYDPANLQLV